MRIDKLLSSMGLASRSEAKKAAKNGEILLNGRIAKENEDIDPSLDSLFFRGKKIEYVEKLYIMLNKPQGVVSSTDGKDGKTVIDLLPPEYKKRGLFPCGRLDKDTLGLLLITNDGELSHRLLSPKKHVCKVYYLKTLYPVTEHDAARLEEGVYIGDGDTSRPSKVELLGSHELKISIVEGMYHQIKRMLEAVNNKVVYLERVNFGALKLDETLERGQWRFLTEDELEALGKQTV